MKFELSVKNCVGYLDSQLWGSILIIFLVPDPLGPPHGPSKNHQHIFLHLFRPIPKNRFFNLFYKDRKTSIFDLGKAIPAQTDIKFELGMKNYGGYRDSQLRGSILIIFSMD